MWTVAQGCSLPIPPDITAFDPVLTQNPKKVGRAGRKQWKTRRANGGKKRKLEPKRLRFVRETTYGPAGREFFVCDHLADLLARCLEQDGRLFDGQDFIARHGPSVIKGSVEIQ